MSGAAVREPVTLHLGDLDQVRLSIATVDYLSVMAMTIDVVGGWQRGVPIAWQQEISRAVDRSGRAAVQPLAEPAVAIMPGCVLPGRPDWTPEVGGVVEKIRSTDPSEVHRNLVAEFGDTAPPAWQGASREPARWISDFSDNAENVAGSLTGLLNRARPLIDRETERAGLAIVRNTLPTLFANLNSRIGFRGNTLTFTHPSPGHYELDGRALVLVPHGLRRPHVAHQLRGSGHRLDRLSGARTG